MKLHLTRRRMYLIVIAWAYVAVMMAVAEATTPNGTVLGAIITFLLYGVLPVGLLIYLMGRPGRRRAREERERAEAQAPAATRSGAPDAGGEAPARAIPPMREEP